VAISKIQPVKKSAAVAKKAPITSPAPKTKALAAPPAKKAPMTSQAPATKALAAKPASAPKAPAKAAAPAIKTSFGTTAQPQMAQANASPGAQGTKSGSIDWTKHGNFGAPPYLPAAGDTPVQRQRTAAGAPYNGTEILAMEARDPAKAREMTREMGAWRQTQPGAGAVAPDGLPWGTQRDAQGNEITEARARANVGDSYATTHTRPSTDMTRSGERYQAITPESQAYMDSLPDSVKNTNMYRMAKQFGKALNPEFVKTKFGDAERQFGLDRDKADFNMDPNSYRHQRINENYNGFRQDLGMPPVNGPVTGGRRPEPGPPPGYGQGGEMAQHTGMPGGGTPALPANAPTPTNPSGQPVRGPRDQNGWNQQMSGLPAAQAAQRQENARFSQETSDRAQAQYDAGTMPPADPGWENGWDAQQRQAGYKTAWNPYGSPQPTYDRGVPYNPPGGGQGSFGPFQGAMASDPAETANAQQADAQFMQQQAPQAPSMPQAAQWGQPAAPASQPFQPAAHANAARARANAMQRGW